MNLRYFLFLGMSLSGIMTAMFGMGFYWQVHSLAFYVVVQVGNSLIRSQAGSLHTQPLICFCVRHRHVLYQSGLWQAACRYRSSLPCSCYAESFNLLVGQPSLQRWATGSEKAGRAETRHKSTGNVSWLHRFWQNGAQRVKCLLTVLSFQSGLFCCWRFFWSMKLMLLSLFLIEGAVW